MPEGNDARISRGLMLVASVMRHVAHDIDDDEYGGELARHLAHHATDLSLLAAELDHGPRPRPILRPV